MSEETSASPDPTPAHQAAPESPQTPPEDLGKKFSDTFKAGRADGEKKILDKIEQLFGTRDLSSIQPTKQKDHESDQEFLQRIQALEQEKATLESRFKEKEVQDRMTQAVDSLRLSPHDRSAMLSKFNAEYTYDMETGRVFRQGSDIPESNGNGVMSSLSDVMKTWATKGENSWLFKTAPQGHVDTGHGVQELPKGFLKNPANVEALKKSGQYEAYLTGKPIDRKALDAHLRAEPQSQTIN